MFILIIRKIIIFISEVNSFTSYVLYMCSYYCPIVWNLKNSGYYSWLTITQKRNFLFNVKNHEINKLWGSFLVFAGENSNRRSVWTVEMYPGRIIHRGGEQKDSNLWPQQIRRKKGKQNSQVFGVHVESALMGYGIRCYNGHCVG